MDGGNRALRFCGSGDPIRQKRCERDKAVDSLHRLESRPLDARREAERAEEGGRCRDTADQLLEAASKLGMGSTAHRLDDGAQRQSGQRACRFGPRWRRPLRVDRELIPKFFPS
jgi:hypothetical protein